MVCVPPRVTQSRSSAESDVYKIKILNYHTASECELGLRENIQTLMLFNVLL